MPVVARPLPGSSAVDRAAETYAVTGTLKHAKLTGFQFVAGGSGATIAELEGPENAGDFAGFSVAAGGEITFATPITAIKLSNGSGVLYNNTARNAIWYVDSVNGDNNTATGLSADSQFRTIAKLLEHFIASGDEIVLADDSYWRESLDISTASNVTVRRSNTGTNRPRLDCADMATGWTLTGGQSNTYEVAWVPTAGDGITTTALTVYEDTGGGFALLDYQDSIANVEANPGSYYVDGFANVAGNTVYVHPTDSGNPNSNGGTYEVSRRGFGLKIGNDCSAIGIHTLRNVSNNGSLNCALNAHVEGCLIEYGTKHNTFANSGLYLNTIIRYNQWQQHTTCTLGVFYEQDATDLEGEYRGCTIIGGKPQTNGDPANWPQNTSALYAHSVEQ